MRKNNRWKLAVAGVSAVAMVAAATPAPAPEAQAQGISISVPNGAGAIGAILAILGGLTGLGFLIKYLSDVTGSSTSSEPELKEPPIPNDVVEWTPPFETDTPWTEVVPPPPFPPTTTDVPPGWIITDIFTTTMTTVSPITTIPEDVDVLPTTSMKVPTTTVAEPSEAPVPVTPTLSPEELKKREQEAKAREILRIAAIVKDFRTRSYEEINRYRKSKGLNALAIDTSMEQPAFLWSAELASRPLEPQSLCPKLEHNSGNYYENVGCWHIGKNAEYKREDPISGWKSSPGHNQNLLRAEVTHMALGIYFVAETGQVFATWRAR